MILSIPFQTTAANDVSELCFVTGIKELSSVTLI